MKSTVIRYGLRSAITIIILFLLGWFLGKNLDFDFQEIIGYVSIVLSLLFVFFGIKHFRDRQNNGIISFGKAFLTGMLITLFASVAFGIIDVIYTTYLNPNFTTEYYRQASEQIHKAYSGVELQEKIQAMENEKALFTNPLISFLLMSFTVFLIGFIISTISSLLLQRKRN
ncbi:MAG TPA: DUF4199 domain-containing protein [Flavobacteriia bacterium]|nr:DUF4199 domain-containing protein [Flavobacteriia bacterium]